MEDLLVELLRKLVREAFREPLDELKSLGEQMATQLQTLQATADALQAEESVEAQQVVILTTAVVNIGAIVAKLEALSDPNLQPIIDELNNTLATAQTNATNIGNQAAALNTDAAGAFPLPVVSAVSPTAVAVAGGTPLTLTGTGFTGATAVDVGTAPATSVVVVSDTSITCDSPALAAGTYDCTVVGPNDTSATSAADQVTAS
jgi:hypothetical protein